MDVMQSIGEWCVLLHVCGVQVLGDDASTHNIRRLWSCEHELVRRRTGSIANGDSDVVHGPVLVKRGH